MFSHRLLRIFRRDSTYYQYRRAKTKSETIDQRAVPEKRSDTNELGIPMIPRELHDRLFGNASTIDSVEDDLLKTIRQRISKAAGVDPEQLTNTKSPSSSSTSTSTTNDAMDLTLPELSADTVEEHFSTIASEQTRDYRQLAENFARMSHIPTMPSKGAWIKKPGWTKYDSMGRAIAIDFPEEDVLVFDVEVLCSGKKPTLAVAMSEKAWYSWCGEDLCQENRDDRNMDAYSSGLLSMHDMIPLESRTGQIDGFERRKKLVIGHNVAFDRSYVKEQYLLKKTNLRFLDTMSMHIAMSGFAGEQRAAYMKHESTKVVKKADESKSPKNDDTWEDRGSMNSLVAVHNHYCPDSRLKINKQGRDVFMDGTLKDVRDKFQDSMEYCARDVLATYEVFAKLLPDFLNRFPHPVTFGGMLEMTTAYLPINENWFHFIKASNETYERITRTVPKLLAKLANDAVGLLKDKRYCDDPWLWDEDWSISEKRSFYKKMSDTLLKPRWSKETPKEYVERVWDELADNMRKTQPYLFRFPKWYVALCERVVRKPEKIENLASVPDGTDDQGKDYEGKWGPTTVTLQMRIAPKLLRMCYDGYPLYFYPTRGWGYLVPDDGLPTDGFKKDSEGHYLTKEGKRFPLRQIQELVKKNRAGITRSTKETKKASKEETTKRSRRDQDEDGSNDSHLPGVSFRKLPHKNGVQFNVGNPLAKDFLHLIDEGKLTSHTPEHAAQLADINRVCSYWKMTRDRVLGQMAVLFNPRDSNGQTGNETSSIEGDDDFPHGAIIPRVIPAGTVTRRAVEPLWMTASNAKVNRIGSELKSMVQAPPGYVFVGADVDSQELWIASLLGDSWKYKIHGSTPFSWMLLRGDKSDGSDQHSMVAKQLGVTRDQAKILNYGRIYGAGLPFATILLKQYRPNAGDEEIGKLAKQLYYKTKGARQQMCLLTEAGMELLKMKSNPVPYITVVKQLGDIAISINEFTSQHYEKKWTEWRNGTESDVFNCLEGIALSDEAATPVLGCRLSRALELGSKNTWFLPSRINWVVQSSAVDYLHLMLVCMQWLFEKYQIDGRFSISIHDEVRYLVAEKDKYRAALALQITNLLTRAMFVSKMGMTGLPKSVAFFNKVDIDRALRKEVYMDAKTPSTPRGLPESYGIPQGEALDMREIMEKTNGGRLDSL